MDRRSKIILLIFGLVLTGIIVSEIVRPKPINWSFSFTAESKIPFGCFVLYEELPNLFPNQEISKVNQSVYEILAGRDSTKQLPLENYLIINDFVGLDEQETNKLLDYVGKGNNVFIAMSGTSSYLADTLNLGFDSEYGIAEDSIQLELTHNTLKKEKYWLSRGTYKNHINSVDTLTTTILGNVRFRKTTGITTTDGEEKLKPNFVKTSFGKGDFYIHANPQAFSNYYMLKTNGDYVRSVFSYLEDRPLVWDNYKKSGRVVITSPMRFVLNQTALKWAYYLTIIGLLLFVIFRAKREQRIIPIIKPNENASVEFARTVGALYYQNKDYSDLIQKKISYFLAYLRSTFYIETNTLNEQTAKLLAAKSGKPLQETKALIDQLSHLKSKPHHTEEDLIGLNNKINDFKQ